MPSPNVISLDDRVRTVLGRGTVLRMEQPKGTAVVRLDNGGYIVRPLEEVHRDGR